MTLVGPAVDDPEVDAERSPDATQLDGAEASDRPDAGDDPHSSTASVDPNTGLPAFPTGPVTETPTWKRRNRPKSQFVKSIVLLVALLTIWLAVYATMESLRPEDRPSEPAPPVPTTVPVGPSATVEPPVAVGAR